jgi:hypothetical protein
MEAEGPSFWILAIISRISPKPCPENPALWSWTPTRTIRF